MNRLLDHDRHHRIRLFAEYARFYTAINKTARAIRLCLRKDIPGPAFALARALNETVLRGRVILHEIGLTELNELLARTQQWQASAPTDKPPPKIEVRGKRWKWVAPGKGGKPTSGTWRKLKCDYAKRWQESVVGMPMLHDLTHGGMTQALQMVHEDMSIGPCHSVENQTRLLYFAERAVLFSMMTWPGALQKYAREIEQTAQRAVARESVWKRQAHQGPDDASAKPHTLASQWRATAARRRSYLSRIEQCTARATPRERRAGSVTASGATTLSSWRDNTLVLISL